MYKQKGKKVRWVPRHSREEEVGSGAADLSRDGKAEGRLEGR